MKIYLAVKSNSLENAEKDIAQFKEKVMEIINSKLNQFNNNVIIAIIYLMIAISLQKIIVKSEHLDVFSKC